jgi:DNA-binding CsgD family transcriptional regulator
VSRTTPLVGRDAELARLDRALGDDGEGGIVLYGAGGVGKTRLASEALSRVEGIGLATARVTATRAAESIPLGALSPLLPDLGERSATALLGAARAALAERAGDRELVLFVDDAHCLDDVSATLILQLSMARTVRVLATVRTGDPLPDPVTRLWADGHVERLDLRPLGDAEMDRVIVDLLGGPVEGGSLATLRRVGDGNVLAVRELVLGGVESGALRQEGGVWRLDGPLGTPRLFELVSQRLDALSPLERRAFELLALGEPLGIPVLERLVDLESVEQLEERGLVEIRVDERREEVWLAHPIHGEILRTRLSPLRRKSLFRDLADATADLLRRRGDVIRLASWRLGAGRSVDPALMLDAARQTFRAIDYVSAERFARAAWDAGVPGEHSTIEAGLLLGHVLFHQARGAEAEPVLQAAEATAQRPLDRALAAVHRAENLFRGLGRFDDAVAVCIEAEQALADPDAAAEVRAHRASMTFWSGDLAGAMALAEPLLAGQAIRPFVAAAAIAVPAMAFDGRTAEAEQLARRAFEAHLPLWEDEVTLLTPGTHRVMLVFAIAESGRLDEAWNLAEFGWSYSVERRNVLGMAWFAYLLARLSGQRGQPREVARWARESDVHLQVLGYHGARRWACAELLAALAVAGQVDEARAARDRLDELQRWPVGFMAERECEARAWLLAAEGHPVDARTMVSEAVDRAIAKGQRGLAAASLHALARLGDPGAAHDRLERLAGELDGAFVPARYRHVRGLVREDGDELDAASAALEACGALLMAAEAAADAARAHRKAGEPRRAAASEQRSAALAARCAGARTQALVTADELQPLTRREREVAVLAADGLSSRSIADRLYLSVRTVDNHLQRVYQKLGVSRREDLRDVLSRAGEA